MPRRQAAPADSSILVEGIAGQPAGVTRGCLFSNQSAPTLFTCSKVGNVHDVWVEGICAEPGKAAADDSAGYW